MVKTHIQDTTGNFRYVDKDKNTQTKTYQKSTTEDKTVNAAIQDTTGIFSKKKYKKDPAHYCKNSKMTVDEQCRTGLLSTKFKRPKSPQPPTNEKRREKKGKMVRILLQEQ